MSFWTSLRDTVESAGSLAGNYLLPGSGMVTSHLTSKGSQEQLNSPLGRIAMLGTGLTGAGVGSDTTGIPSASSMGYGWGNALGSLGNAMNLGSDMGQSWMPAFGSQGATGASLGTGMEGQGMLTSMENQGNWWDKFMSSMGGSSNTSGMGGSGGGGMSSPMNMMRLLAGGLGIGQSLQMGNMAKQMDGMAPYRAQYASQLSGLMNDPSKITSMPGYAAGMEAVQRGMASQGMMGSGNMATALQKYGGDFFNNQVNQLQGLASGNPQAQMMASMASMTGLQSSLGLLAGGKF